MNVLPASGVEQRRLEACELAPEADDTAVVERVGLHGSSLTFIGDGSSLYGCSAIPDPVTVDDPDNPGGGIWCGAAAGRLDAGELNDPRLTLCQSEDGDLTGFAWIEPQPATKWIVVSDAGHREVYEVAESLPVRVTTTENIDPDGGQASFDIEEYAADGTELREYVLEAQVAG